jgi:hypothetical protein
MTSPSNSSKHIAERLFTSFFIIIGIFGLVSPYQYNILPANAFFELVLFAIGITTLKPPKKEIIAYAIAAFLYVVAAYLSSTAKSPAHLLDFAQAYKAFIYIPPLCLIYRRNLFDHTRMVFLLKTIILLFLLKYGYSVALKLDSHQANRPGLYTENNFELIFLMLAFFILKNEFRESMTKWFIFIAIAVALSGSRSSVVALLILFWGTYFNKLSYKTLIYLTAYSGLIAIAIGIFNSRLSGEDITSIDRYRFFQIFLEETSNWSITDFLIGSPALTPLSHYSCAALSSYQDLFSFSGDGSCYSVILHSYFMRVIFDHGVLGLFFLLMFIYQALRGCNYRQFDIWIILGILLSSALSVSAMNSIYTNLALALAFGLKQKSHPTAATYQSK